VEKKMHKPINEIVVGDRHRKQAGDIAALAQNIDEIGLLHPIVIDPAGRLIAGARRLMAFRHLRRATIPTKVIDLDKLVLGEYAENAFRQAFTPSQLVSILRSSKARHSTLRSSRVRCSIAPAFQTRRKFVDSLTLIRKPPRPAPFDNGVWSTPA
jgi:ParB-like nuclease domain